MEDTTIKVGRDTHEEMTKQMHKSDTYDSYLRKLLKLARKYKKEMELVS